MNRIVKVISGGQTGVDQAGLRAAKACGLETGGTAPRGFRTDDGPAPWLAADYGLSEHASAEYPPRTADNVMSADATILFGAPSPGTNLTHRLCVADRKPFVWVFWGLGTLGRYTPVGEWGTSHTPGMVATWAMSIGKPPCDLVLNIAGNRERSTPGISAVAEQYLRDVFERVGELWRRGTP